MLVCQNHSHALIPLGITGEPLWLVWHMTAVMGAEPPICDIGDEIRYTIMLVLDYAQWEPWRRPSAPAPSD
jgi:hypothetical protein